MERWLNLLKVAVMKHNCKENVAEVAQFLILALQNHLTGTKAGRTQHEAEVKLLCCDAKRKQRRCLTLSFSAVGLWVWARDRNSLYRHCVCDCWNDSTVERFVRCHQGKLRQQKHTHSGKKKTSTREGSFPSSKCLPGVSVGNKTPSRGGNLCSFTQISHDNAERFSSRCWSVPL